MDQPIKRIHLIGLGLIGGSIALSVKKEFPDAWITGYDINQSQLEIAKTLTVIDEAAGSQFENIETADLVILAAPVEQTLSMIETLSGMKLKKDVIITDVGSTKQKITACAAAAFKGDVHFIGGHPMAGSHKSGVTAARAHLFENAFYILTPAKTTSEDSLNKLKNILKGTNAHFIEMTPEVHDEVTGVISHFPHIVAASLVHQAGRFEDTHPVIKRLAAGGFRDITRIASSSPAMWRDILLHNKEKLLTLFEDWEREMSRVKHMVEDLDSFALFSYFKEAKDYRDGLPEREKGAIPSFYDLYVDVPDYPGVISEITGYLAMEEISITNIRIIETREEIYGVLRLSFQTDIDRERAQKCIEKYTDYKTFFS
ncbi:prephenate dehydrogenase [Metabacillus indicus]|uniref:prephenate dehydrogenase n=1 Tax=Metabacillus indicus TaxID=246786 RepID=UPI002492E070|nr:prephenate dehydrogenase [Metabacillus indicus]